MRWFVWGLAGVLAMATSVAAAEIAMPAGFNGAALAALLAGKSATAAAEMEKPAAINGTTYAVISPLFDGSSGSTSYLRLFNGGGAASTFNILVVNAANGITMGATAIQVPKSASPQYPLTGTNSIFSMAGVAPSINGSYALYILNSEYASAYQHVTFNGTSGLFENQSVCTSPINQKLSPSNMQVLTNVHTTALAANAYPSVLGLHNYSANPVAAKLTAYDAVTGASIGNVTQTIPANSTLSLAESQLEGLLNFHPTSAQLHINVVVTNTNNAAVPIGVTQSIRNVALGGEINMAEACAINPTAALVVTTPAPTDVTTAYCGTFTEPTPYGTLTGGFVASVAPSGKIKVLAAGGVASFIAIDAAEGQLSGTRFTMTSVLDGRVYSGTVQNGAVNVSAAGAYGGLVSGSGSMSNCAS